MLIQSFNQKLIQVSVLISIIGLSLLGRGAVAAQPTSVVVFDGTRAVAKTSKTRFDFVEVEKGVQALVLRAVLRIPGTGLAVGIEGEGVVFDSKAAAEGRFMIGLGAMKTNLKVSYKDGKSRQFVVKINLDENVVKQSGCEEIGMQFIRADKQSPSQISVRGSRPIDAAKAQTIFVGIRCEQKADRVGVSISFPQEVEWGVTSIFEVSGKGERWKAYDISRSTKTAEKGAIAQFSLRMDQETLNYSLEQKTDEKSGAKKVEEKEKSADLSRMTWVGFGGAQVSIQTTTGSLSSMGPLLNIESLTSPLFWNFRAHGAFDVVLPLGGSQFYALDVAAGPTFVSGKPENPGLFGLFFNYMSIGQDQEVSGRNYSFRHNQIGAELFYRMAIGESSGLGILAGYNGLGGDSTALLVKLRYENRLGHQRAWAAGIGYFSESAKAAVGNLQFGQMFAFGQYGF